MLANNWSVNYTDPREGSATGYINPQDLDYNYLSSGNAFVGTLAPLFEVR